MNLGDTLNLLLGFVFVLAFCLGFGMGIMTEKDNMKHRFEGMNAKIITFQIQGTNEEENESIISDVYCDLETMICGNDMFYKDGKGFIWCLNNGSYIMDINVMNLGYGG